MAGLASGTNGLVVRGLAKTYEQPGITSAPVLAGLDLEAREGEIVAVVGASGSGKSTLLHVLGGMLHPDAGEVRLDEVRPWRLSQDARADWRNSQVGFVFQAHHLLGELNALENVLVPAWLDGRDPVEARRVATDLLERLGLAERLQHLPRELSGGEAQRVAVARALVRSPRLVLADEPTGDLDREAGERVFEQFVSLQRERRFIALVATHGEAVVARCHRVLELRDGRLRPRGAGVLSPGTGVEADGGVHENGSAA